LYISKIYIRDFRNISQLEYFPDKGLNILIGTNAQGKTNFLEAIYLVTNRTSFRSVQDRHLVKFNEEGFQIQIDYNLDDKNNSLKIEYLIGKRKKITLNNKRILPDQDRLKATLFTPDDLYLLKGPPVRRRSFLDSLLIQISNDYKRNLDDYEQLLSRRNNLLKADSLDMAMLEALDHIFAATAAHIIMARLNILRHLEKYAVNSYQTIGGDDTLRLKYAVSFPLPAGKISYETVKEELLLNTISLRSRECRMKNTLVGPHRDDINFYINEKNAKIFASQGQQRNIVIALKLAELETIHRTTGVYPLFLLDEVLAELDSQKRDLIIGVLQESSFQTFLTSVEISLFRDINGKIIRLDNGKLIL